MTMTPDQRFRLVNTYAFNRGYVGGFPNFNEANYGQGVVYGVHLLRGDVAEWQDIPRSDYGAYHIDDVPALFRGAATYAAANGYPGAYPNCNQADHGQGVVYGTIFIKPGEGEWRDVPRSTLGSPNINDVGAMMRAAATYAANNGYAAAFPTFHQADHGAGVVYGMVLLPMGNAEWRDVLVDELAGQDPQDERTCVILCRLRNDDGSLTNTIADPGFYRQFFFQRQTGGLADYYADVTHGRVNIVGDLFGWLDIGHTMSEHQAVANKGQRTQAFQWGLQAARDAGADPDSYARQVVVLNQPTDWGGVQRGLSMILPDSATASWSHSRAAHEFGHVLGLDDAFSTEQMPDGTIVDSQYLDENCIMSYATSGSRYGASVDGRSFETGPGLSGLNAFFLSGIPPWRIHSVPEVGAAETIQLAALTHPFEDGFLLAKVPPTASRPNTYWVEFRHNSNWDRAIPQPRVDVHESRDGDLTAFALSVNGTQNLTNPQDEALVTPDGSIGFRLVTIDGPTALVRVWELGPNGAQQVRIANVIFDPPGDVLNERVIIRNDKVTIVWLGGWTLHDTRNHPNSPPTTYVFPDVQLAPGEDIVVWTGSGYDDGHNLYWGRQQAVWNNTGDTAVLLDNNGLEISRFAY
jgi:hypothetical protein